jgi:type IV secretion system protein VirB10
MRFLTFLLLCASLSFAQTSASPDAPKSITVPAGQKLLMQLKSGINTKTAKVGDGVYMETSFPVSIDNVMAIPPGTYVQGEIDSVKRAGRIKGRAEVLFHFTTLIFPSGYTVLIPGSVNSVPGADSGHVKDKEGTIQAEGSKGKDAATIGAAAGEGTLAGAEIGAITGHPGKGALIGGGLGGAVGTAIVLLTRGNEVVYPAGTPVEMILQRPLTLQQQKLREVKADYTPRQGPAPMEKPRLTPEPTPR